MVGIAPGDHRRRALQGPLRRRPRQVPIRVPLMARRRAVLPAYPAAAPSDSLSRLRARQPLVHGQRRLGHRRSPPPTPWHAARGGTPTPAIVSALFKTGSFAPGSIAALALPGPVPTVTVSW